MHKVSFQTSYATSRIFMDLEREAGYELTGRSWEVSSILRPPLASAADLESVESQLQEEETPVPGAGSASAGGDEPECLHVDFVVTCAGTSQATFYHYAA
ncbi:hypothetical protein AK812_SmicGene46051, partial [Symbiodinium microadriaticum]